MGKRKSEEKKERSHLLKKIKKLEKRIKNLESDSSEEEIVMSSENEHTPELVNIELLNDDDHPTIEETPSEALEEEVLEILGVTPQPENTGVKLRQEIAQRWDSILKKGLDKEVKQKIVQENPPFTNLNLMVPPKLNPEVSSAVNDMARKRDFLIQKRQNQITTALSCLGSGLEMCLKDIQNQKMNIIKKLNDASQLLCDSLYIDTRGRRSLLLSVINKDMKESLLQMEPETYLFGENLADKIKTAKSVQRSSQELKVVENKKFTPRQNTLVSRSNINKNKTLNWRGPPRTEVKKRGGPSPRAPMDRKREEKRSYQHRK